MSRASRAEPVKVRSAGALPSAIAATTTGDTNASGASRRTSRSEEKASYDRPSYSLMIVSSFVTNPYDFCTDGYAPDFLRYWWNARIAAGEIVKTPEGYRFTPEAEAALLHRLAIVTGITEAGAS
jgi:hypothetical protein